MRLHKVSSVLMWSHLVPALWSAFVTVVGVTDESFNLHDLSSFAILGAYILMVVLQVLFLLLFFFEKLQKTVAMWLLTFIITVILTGGAFFTVYTINLWRTIEGGLMGILLIAYASFICWFTYLGLKKANKVQN